MQESCGLYEYCCPKRNHKETFVENFPPEHFQDILDNNGKQGEAVLFASPRNAVAFLTPFSVRRKHGARCLAVCGRRQGVIPRSAGKCPKDKGDGLVELSPLDPRPLFLRKKRRKKTFITCALFSVISCDKL